MCLTNYLTCFNVKGIPMQLMEIKCQEILFHYSQSDKSSSIK
jgi:hypothetical protein